MILPPSLLLCALFLGGEKVVINEFAYDDTSTDDREFVELYNPTSKAIDISGWRLESNDQNGANRTYVVPAKTVLVAGGFYVMGSAKVANVNQIVGTTNIWENSQESLILKDKDGNIIDSLGYEINKGTWANIKLEGEGLWGNHQSSEVIETSWSRLRDGYDTNQSTDWRVQPATPGKTNNQPAGIFRDVLDTRTPLTEVTEFGASFKRPRVVDPTVVDQTGYNPNAITASPQGKLAMVAWDETGGGNANMLLRDPTCNVIIEAWVYFDAKLEKTGEREVWSIGKGTTGSFFNSPDPSGKLGFTANGNTGVTWTFEVTDSAATLYLVDHNDGGWGANAKTKRNVLGSVVLKAGTNDGWKRLRLEIIGDTATGFFGGTYGSTTTGTKITGKISAPAQGGVYIGYREAVSNKATVRPFTCDHVTIIPTATKEVIDTTFGTARATTKGTPRIGVNSCPLVGNSSFRLTGVDFVPSGKSIWAFGVVAGAPVDLSKLGGQTGSFLYVTPFIELTFTADAVGDISVPIPIPSAASTKGAMIDIQAFDIDPGLSTAIKVGNSRVLKLKVD